MVEKSGPSFHPGDEVFVRDAFDIWHRAEALSVIEGTHHGGGRKVHDFPVVWVSIDGGERVPWPVEDVVKTEDEALQRDMAIREGRS